MNYRSICESNQLLYAALQQLSHEIRRCEQYNRTDKAIQLSKHKQAIKRQISYNLDMIEAIWNAMEAKRPAANEVNRKKPTKLEQNIITAYTRGKDNRESAIAARLHVNQNDVTRTINKYLQGYFRQVA